MTKEQMRWLFPQASEAFLKANGPEESGHEIIGNLLKEWPGKLSENTDEAKLNKLERAYLGHLRASGYPRIGIQNITLKLAHDCRLTPDFNIYKEGFFTFIDVKGFQREDALIKMKVAARTFPWARFEIVKRTKTGQWDHQHVKA